MPPLLGRIHGKKAFDYLKSSGIRVSTPLFTATFAADPSAVAANEARVAYALNRKFGTAVKRNRFRRRLREVLRLYEQPALAGSYLFICRPQAQNLSQSELCQEIRALMNKLSERVS